MTLSINSLTPKSQLHQIQNNSKKQEKKLTELSKGKKDPLDDVIASAKAASLESSIRGIDTVEQGVNTQQSTLNVAAGGLSNTLENLQKMREYAVQAADSTLSSSDRSNLQTQSNQVKDQINQTASTTEFDGTKLLDGSYSDKQVQTGPDGGDTINVSIDSATAESIGVNNIDLSSTEGANNAISQIDSAINQVSNSLAGIGSSQTRLDAAAQNNADKKINLAKAKQTFEELDIAKATSELQSINLRKQVGLAVLAKTNKNNESTFSSLV